MWTVSDEWRTNHLRLGSEFQCLANKLCLAGIREPFDKALVGCSMGQRQSTYQVVSALAIALSRRSPDKELVQHSEIRSPKPLK